ncbi:hypothetical protein AVEN_247211-1 [Araneus ventricosus]|uniref:CCHC-type domain-containing protein n=1 Tax=Araneus ventricosus TaxID=182803 RepID=A0A4Y2WB37_ARAVE|nr:hypothetical protein AVEN_247211-1 [Araneus ventricosus]
MATSREISDKALKSESLLGLAKSGAKGKTKKPKALSKKSLAGSDDDFQDATGILKKTGKGKQSTVQNLVLQGPVIGHYRFGQTNPFGLPPKTLEPQVSVPEASTSTLPEGYVGFGLAMGLPPGVCWGDTPFPGEARVDVSSPADTQAAHPTETNLVAPPTTSDVLTDAVDKMDNEDFSDASDTSMITGTPPVEAVKSGHKRRQAKTPKRTKKLITDGPEGSIETFSQGHSSSDSDKTIIVPDSMDFRSGEKGNPSIEIPATPPPAQEQDSSVFHYPKEDHEMLNSVAFLRADYSYENTKVYPWIWHLFSILMQTDPAVEHVPTSTASDTYQFLQAISDYFLIKQNHWTNVQEENTKLLAEKRRLEEDKEKLEEQLRTGAHLPARPPSLSRPAWNAVVQSRSRTKGPPLSAAPTAVHSVVTSSVSAQMDAPLVFNQLPIQQPPSVPFAARVKLKPRQGLPTVIVRPLGEMFGSSAELKTLLEDKVSPKDLGVKIVACLPASGKGVIVRTESPAMAQTLRDHINAHSDLNGVCRAEEPRKPHPRILIYDVPPLSGDRGEQEARFLAQLERSNSFSEGTTKVIFRRKGRGEAQHWVISLDPAAFQSLGQSTRLHWGFGSFRFRPFSEPQQCYKCLRFGHTQTICQATALQCSRCPGTHSYKTCQEQQPRCRNCVEFNKRARKGQLLNVHHTAVSRKCPVFIRECEEFQGRFNLGT